MKLDWGVSGKQQPNSPSLDRIDSTKDLVIRNKTTPELDVYRID